MKIFYIGRNNGNGMAAGCIAKRECGLIIIIMNQICQPVLHLLQVLGSSPSSAILFSRDVLL